MRSPHLSPEHYQMTSLAARRDAAGELSVEAAERPDQQQDRDRHAQKPEQEITAHSSLQFLRLTNAEMELWFLPVRPPARPHGDKTPGAAPLPAYRGPDRAS